MRLRLGTPKYCKTFSGLAALGFGLGGLSRYDGEDATWMSTLGWLILAVAMLIMVVGIRAERREWEAKMRAGDKQ